MSNLLLQLVKALVAAMVAMLSPEQVGKIVGAAFDKIEKMVVDSETHWDDTIVLPMLTALRAGLNIPASETD